MASSSSSAAAPRPPLGGPSSVFVDRVDGGGPYIILSQPTGYSAQILLYGGQVISWTNGRGDELLYVKTKAVFEPPHPIQGGIPICFPKFFDNANTERRHGFARRTSWRTDNTDMPPPPNNHAYADLILDHMPINYPKYWPNRFELRLRVVLEPTGRLSMITRIKNVNTDGRSFTFPFSYQTYFSVSDISEIQIEGLEGRDYLDYMLNRVRFNQGAEAFTFNYAVDRLYPDTPNTITLTDNERRITFTIEKSGDTLPDIVVWNHWYKDEDPRSVSNDLDDREMVCVEAAAQHKEIMLLPDQECEAIQHLSVTEYKDKRKCLSLTEYKSKRKFSL